MAQATWSAGTCEDISENRSTQSRRCCLTIVDRSFNDLSFGDVFSRGWGPGHVKEFAPFIPVLVLVMLGLPSPISVISDISFPVFVLFPLAKPRSPCRSNRRLSPNHRLTSTVSEFVGNMLEEISSEDYRTPESSSFFLASFLVSLHSSSFSCSSSSSSFHSHSPLPCFFHLYCRLRHRHHEHRPSWCFVCPVILRPNHD